MKKKENIYKEDEKGVLIVRAFMLIKESNFNIADKWWILNEYHRWLEAQQKLNQLYSDKPDNWIANSRIASNIKFSAMRNMVNFIRGNYTKQGYIDGPGSGYYAFLDRLFGKGQWDESGLQ